MSKVRLYGRIARLLATVGLGLLVAGTMTLVERLHLRNESLIRQRLTRWYLARLSAALPFTIEVRGSLPKQPMLWISNHVSWTDIPLLGMLAPLSFLSKAEVRTWPVAGWLAKKAGTLFIRRGSGDSALLGQQLLAHLQQQRSLLIFPEGTTTDGRQLRTFHGRLLSSAIEAGTALQPVAIRYVRNNQIDTEIAPFVGDDDLISHLLRLLSSDVASVRIHLLEPIETVGASRNVLAKQAHRAIGFALFGETEAVEVEEQGTDLAA
ncbi:lysophospholipid acyltransferase family protein [Pseudomonas turukhanskensis]|uniref:1-acyl-sn-glycerol-3-phosphate acyltransferase n=1 Tax=Pseudomonas turukhanskensis TaxID=1806536 RepID=A0A9W6NFN5_9PSED|nr:1-acyl-sn-glycerol-3-phosphate acyltransferase [Pseudomonas turukhanskensis]GLK89022.1 1-acyl-sn-glycerol-3-phosphate acyltransferase [Pseudomonas turukhanskensis]